MNNDDLNRKLENYLADDEVVFDDVPETTRAKYASIAENLPKDNNKRRSRKNRPVGNGSNEHTTEMAPRGVGYGAVAAYSVWAKIIIGVLAILVVATAIILPIMLNQSTPAYQYTDDDWTFKETTIEELSSKYDVLLPADEFFIDEQFNSYEIAVAEEDEVDIFLRLSLFSLENFDDLRIVVILTDNYDYTYKADYENLSQMVSTEKFDYKYEVYSLGETANACFEYEGYKYYLHLSNAIEPERITTIISSLSQ